MKQQEFSNLNFGDVVKFRGQGKDYLIISNDRGKIKAVSVVEDVRPENWEIVAKAEYPSKYVKADKLAGERWTDADEKDQENMEILKNW